MIKLLPHNEKAYIDVKTTFNEGKQRSCIVHATGTGKSYIIGALSYEFNNVIVIAPNNIVLQETRKVCKKGTEFSTYASVMTRSKDKKKYNLIVLDEFHRSGAKQWEHGVKNLIERNPDAKIFGATATHIRYLDNERNMADEMFDNNIVSHISIKDAIDMKILPNPIYVSSIYSVDEDIKKLKESIMRTSSSKRIKKVCNNKLRMIKDNWNNSTGVPSIIKKYFSNDVKRIIVFCSDVKKASSARSIIGRWLNKAGYNDVDFYNVDYTENKLMHVISDFRSPVKDGHIKVAISVNMLNEGIHVPGVDAIIMLRSTISPIVIEQQIGRCLTVDNIDKAPVVIDLVNNLKSINYSSSFQKDTPCPSYARYRCVMEKYEFPFTVIDEYSDIRSLLDSVSHRFEILSKEECHQVALKYKRKVDFISQDTNVYHRALRHGWLNDICSHMENVYRILSPELVKEIASAYNTIKEFQNADKSAYNYAYKHGIMKDVCAHMKKPPTMWNYKLCKEEASKYKSRTEFYKKNGTAYNYARKKGILNEICAHMPKPVARYTKESAGVIAARYSTRKQFQINAPGAYRRSLKNGWLDDFFTKTK